MTKQINRVQFTLNPAKVTLTMDEIKTIIRAAGDIVYQGGRSLLAKILKGLKEKKLVELDLDNNPSYRAFKNDSIEIITSKIDWMIKNHYLNIEYDYRLPLIIYEERGFEIAKDLISDEYFESIKVAVDKSEYQLALNLKDKNRDTIFILLEKIRKNNDNRFIPFLEYWKENDYKKVRARINSVINDLK